MAQSFYLTDGTTTVNFLTGTLKLAESGWNTQSASGGYAWETVELVAVDTAANIRTAVKSLHRLLDEARKFLGRPTTPTAVTLVYASEGETTKQAVVVDGVLETLGNEGFMGPLLHVGGLRFRLALKRFDYWEALTHTDALAAGTEYTQWVTKIAVGNAAGDIDQRIKKLQLVYSSGAETITKLWAGIRPLNQGSANYTVAHQAEDASNLTDASDVVDAAASGGNAVEITFATDATLVNRLYALLTGAYDADYEGEYMLLMRAKANATTTEVRIQLRAGQYLIADQILGELYISGDDSYKIYEMGRLTIPQYGTQFSGFPLLNLFAERLSVAGSIRIDGFVLMPVQHMLFAEPSIHSGDDNLTVYTDENNLVYAYNRFASVNRQRPFQTFNWAYPPEGGVLVIAANGAFSCNFTVEMDLLPRYKMFR